MQMLTRSKKFYMNASLKSGQNVHVHQYVHKNVGSLIDDDQDVERRKQLATVALTKLNNFWLKDNKLKN